MKTAEEQLAFDTIDKLTRSLNIMGREEERIKLLVATMHNEHRTLQQAFTRFVLAWLVHLAELKEGHYDGRNEASVRIARKLLEGVDVKYDLHLPLI